MMSPFWRYSRVLRIGNRPFIGILKLYFFFFLSTGEHLKGLQLAGVAQAHGEARFDDVYGCCRHPSDQLAIFSLLFLEEKIITNNL